MAQCLAAKKLTLGKYSKESWPTDQAQLIGHAEQMSHVLSYSMGGAVGEGNAVSNSGLQADFCTFKDSK